MPTSEAHLCAIRAIADWITASKITKGYLFRKFASGDRVAEANQPMVSLFEWKHAFLLANHFRHLKDFWKCSATISSMSAWTRPPMAPTHSDEVAASSCMLSAVGHCAASVSGEAGAWSLQI